MAERERERAEKDKETERERRAAWQAGRPTKLAESVPVYASEELDIAER